MGVSASGAEVGAFTAVARLKLAGATPGHLLLHSSQQLGDWISRRVSGPFTPIPSTVRNCWSKKQLNETLSRKEKEFQRYAFIFHKSYTAFYACTFTQTSNIHHIYKENYGRINSAQTKNISLQGERWDPSNPENEFILSLTAREMYLELASAWMYIWLLRMSDGGQKKSNSKH